MIYKASTIEKKTAFNTSGYNESVQLTILTLSLDTPFIGVRLTPCMLHRKLCQYVIENFDCLIMTQLRIDVGVFLNRKSVVSEYSQACEEGRKIGIHPTNDGAFKVSHVAKFEVPHARIRRFHPVQAKPFSHWHTDVGLEIILHSPTAMWSFEHSGAVDQHVKQGFKIMSGFMDHTLSFAQ